MKPNQKLTPKYWVHHHIEDDDILFPTLAKSYQMSVDACVELLGFDYYHEIIGDKIKCILISIEEVKQNE